MSCGASTLWSFEFNGLGYKFIQRRNILLLLIAYYAFYFEITTQQTLAIDIQ
jgi:hypothetical protein